MTARWKFLLRFAVLSRERSETAKDLKSRILRSFGVFAPQDDGVGSP